MSREHLDDQTVQEHLEDHLEDFMHAVPFDSAWD